MLKISITLYVIYHPHYKKKSGMTKSIYKPFLLKLPPRLTESTHKYSRLQLPQKLLFLLSVLSHCIIKVMNLLYDMSDISKYWFAIYHLHYKDK